MALIIVLQVRGELPGLLAGGLWCASGQLPSALRAETLILPSRGKDVAFASQRILLWIGATARPSIFWGILVLGKHLAPVTSSSVGSGLVNCEAK